jgi:protein-S-isoprenylcysteine O-methyltransferase Ste14
MLNYHLTAFPGMQEKNTGRVTIEMSRDTAHESRWQISEVIFGIPFLTAIALHLVVPLRLSRGFLTTVLIAGGVTFFIVGVILIILARREFGQYTDPGHPSTIIVTTGVFSFSRNPLYLGVVCILMGIALASNLLWVLAFLIPSLVACHYILIIPEEKYLTARFGEEYRTYAASVRRWLGRRSQK